MAANRTRVQVRGSIGKSVHIPSGPVSGGATIGVNLRLPNGTIPTLQQLAAALQTGAATQDLPGNINPGTGGGGAQALIWQNIQYVPQSVLNPPRPIPEDEPEDVRIIPGPPGKDGVIGVNGQPGVTIYPDDVDDVVQMPGPPGPTGNAGPQGSQGAPGVTIPMYPDDGEDQVFVPGPPGPAGAGGGGGSNPFNVTPYTHVSGVPAFLANDEFEGVTLDTGGTRFSGATAWAKVNFTGVASAVLAGGALVLTGDTSVSANENIILQAAAGAGTWTYQVAMFAHNGTAGAHNSSMGLMLRNSANGRYTKFGMYYNTGWLYLVQQLTSPTLVSSNPLSAGGFPSTTFLTNDTIPLFLQVVFDGTNLKYMVSPSGVPGTFVQIYTETAASWLGATPTEVGLTVNSDTGTSVVMIADHFRRVA